MTTPLTASAGSGAVPIDPASRATSPRLTPEISLAMADHLLQPRETKMDRRHFLKGLGAGAIGLSLEAIASAAWSAPRSAADRRRVLGTKRGAKFAKIIGFGCAGCNFVLAASRSGAASETAELIAVDLDRVNLRHVEAASSAMPGGPPIKTL